MDGSKRVEGAGAGVILISPEDDKLKYVLRMTFLNTSNNEAEYEALMHGMKMAKACGATRLKIFGDSQLVAQQVMNQCDAVNDSMVAYRRCTTKLFDGCEVNHISRLSNDKADVLANIGSQCLPIPPGVFWEEIAERSTKTKKVQKKTKEEKTSAPHKEVRDEEEDQEQERTPDEAEELLAKIGRNHDDWTTPEPTPTPILKKRGLIKLNDEDMREAKKSLKGIKSEDVKNLPPIEDICEIIPPSSMIEYMKDIVTNKRKIPNEEISTMLANYSFNGKVPKLGDPGDSSDWTESSVRRCTRHMAKTGGYKFEFMKDKSTTRKKAQASKPDEAEEEVVPFIPVPTLQHIGRQLQISEEELTEEKLMANSDDSKGTTSNSNDD
ncbi:hypothetical protein QYE76_061160 [Lolium multiflorum]|uniref:RNase H type-1 domain-containing protein n=1 Tax=Lolium multiflorum TaxID=4521 RepID=A0AAD8W632_LOLMU|nr:hypothetical protein QYE76_061160 [Lolium multiflorum]